MRRVEDASLLNSCGSNRLRVLCSSRWTMARSVHRCGASTASPRLAHRLFHRWSRCPAAL